MKLQKSNLYSIILLSLVVLSIVQTGRLWFDGISGYNPFYRGDLDSKRNMVPSNISETYNMTKPQEMIIYLPTKDPSFAKISRTTKEYTTLYKATTQILESFLTHATYETKELDYNLFWDGVQGGLLFSYDYLLNSSILKEEILKDTKVDVDSIGGVDMMYVQLIKSANQEAKVYLVNTESNKMIMLKKTADNSDFASLYTLEDENLSVLSYIDQQVNIDFAFLSTKKSNKKKFVENNFLRVPVKSEYYLNSNKIEFSNPFIAEDKVDESTFGAYATTFFNHVPQHTNSEGYSYYLYWDSKINLKYTNNGLLEYNKTGFDEIKNQSIATAYDIAMKYLKTYLTWNEYYLSHYVKNENGDLTFYFDYSQNDYPIYISGLEKLNMIHPISINIRDHQVQEAKIYLIEKKENSQGRINLVQSKDYYTDVLNRIGNIGDIEVMQPVYYLTLGGQKTMKLTWILDTLEDGIITEEMQMVEDKNGVG